MILIFSVASTRTKSSSLTRRHSSHKRSSATTHDVTLPKLTSSKIKFSSDPFSRMTNALNDELTEDQKDVIRMDMSGRLDDESLTDITFIKVLMKAKTLFKDDLVDYLTQALRHTESEHLLPLVKEYEQNQYVHVRAMRVDQPPAYDAGSSDSAPDSERQVFDRNAHAYRTAPAKFRGAQTSELAVAPLPSAQESRDEPLPPARESRDEPLAESGIIPSDEATSEVTGESENSTTPSSAASPPTGAEFEPNSCKKAAQSDSTSDGSTDADAKTPVEHTDTIVDARVMEGASGGTDVEQAEDNSTEKSLKKKNAKNESKLKKLSRFLKGGH